MKIYVKISRSYEKGIIYPIYEMAKILHTTVKSLKSIENGKIPSRVSVRIVINASVAFKCKAADLFLESLGELNT